MVSKSILNEYYNIPLNQIGFFQYNNENYYLSKNNDISKYVQYINLTHFPAYSLLNNIFNQPISDNHCLYKYQNNNIDINDLIYYSLQIIETKNVVDIKKSWIKLMNDSQSNFKNELVYHYNFALGQLAIELLNFYFSKDIQIKLGFEHIVSYPDVKNICNPDNLVIATRINDLEYLFCHDFITDEQMIRIIEKYYLDERDLIILLCKNIYPNIFFTNVLNNQINLNEEYKRLKNNLSHIKRLINILNHYIKIPIIYWIKNNVNTL